MSMMGTEGPDMPPVDTSGGQGLSEWEARGIVERFAKAYEARDVDAVLEMFADDGDWRVGPGTFTGKEAVRRLVEWDVSLSPALTSTLEGVGIVAKGNVAFREHRIEQLIEGVPTAYPVMSVYELNEAGKIQHLRSYCEKLGLMQQVANKLPGVKGWFFKKTINMIVAQGEKGLKK